MLIDFHNKSVDDKHWKQYKTDMNDRNLYYWKLWKSAVEDMNYGRKANPLVGKPRPAIKI
jgi:hypothetical protein